MRQRTEIEHVTDRASMIRLEINELTSVLKPNWWDVKARYRWFRLKQRVRNDRRRLDPETQLALIWAEEALEREFLFREEF